MSIFDVPRRWKENVSSKRWYLFSWGSGVTSQKDCDLRCNVFSCNEMQHTACRSAQYWFRIMKVSSDDSSMFIYRWRILLNCIIFPSNIDVAQQWALSVCAGDASFGDNGHLFLADAILKLCIYGSLISSTASMQQCGLLDCRNVINRLEWNLAKKRAMKISSRLVRASDKLQVKYPSTWS